MMTKWTEDQTKAIELRHRNILVAAAAGSGKTAVLVERIIQSLLHGGCDVDRLLVLTFTNAAAAEMRDRIDGALQKELAEAEDSDTIARLERQLVLLSGASISTFHSFCQRVIRTNLSEVDLDPQFRLADEQEKQLLQQDTIDALFEELYAKKDKHFMAFTDAYGDNRGDEKAKKLVLAVWRFAQAQPFPEDWLAEQPKRYEAKEEDLWQEPWIQILYPYLEHAIDAWMESARELLPFQSDVEGSGYAIAIDEIYGLVSACYNDFHAHAPWDAIQQRIAAFAWPNFTKNPYRKAPEDPEVKAACKAAIDSLKTQFEEMSTQYFPASEEGIREEIAACAGPVAELCTLAIQFSRAFQQAKKEKNIADFGDLEHFALQILSDDEVRRTTGKIVPSATAIALQEKYQEIMVDEYQDTNSVQEAIFSLVARPDDPNVFLVGDVKQSIYKFRLADPDLIQQKQNAYPKLAAEGKPYALIHLKKNFRSRAGVLDAVNVLFTQVMQSGTMEIDYDEEEALYAGLDYPELPKGRAGLDGPVELAVVMNPDAKKEKAAENEEDEEEAQPELKNLEAEGQYMAERIQKMIDAQTLVYDKGLKGYRAMQWRDAAILMRSVQGKAQIVLEQLRKNGIPAYADADAGYFEAQEVRIVLDLLACLDNVRQDIPLAAIMASPIGDFSMQDIAKIRAASPDTDLYGALLAAYAPESKLSGRLADKAAAFHNRMADWRNAARDLRVPELIRYLYQATGYYNYVGGLPGGLLRQANLRMLIDRASAYEKTNYRGLYRFLRFIDQMKKRETDLSVARTLGAGENVVRIMTIHKSKGLEFPVVFVPDMAKRFQLDDKETTVLLHKKLGIGPKVVDPETSQCYQTAPWRTIRQSKHAETKAEELRVLYVALTRAREKLILTASMKETEWENKAKKWAGLADAEGTVLPSGKVLSADSFLDWVLMALMRMPDGRPLRETAGIAGGATLSLPRYDKGHYKIHIVQQEDLHPVTEEREKDADTILEAVHAMKPLEASEARDKVASILGWHYDTQGLENVSAKLTVTEIKRRFAEPDEQPVPAVQPQEEKQQPWKRPVFVQDRKGRSGAEYGTLMHSVMQHIDFAGDTSFQGLQAQVRLMAAKEIIREEDISAIYIKSLQGFCDSKLGKEVRSTKQVWRELPFSRLLPAKKFYDGLPKDSEEEVFVQGVIDLLYEREPGRYVLVDYKTDRDTDPEHAEKRHREQIRLYREAVEAVTGGEVAEAYLYLLKDGTIVPM